MGSFPIKSSSKSHDFADYEAGKKRRYELLFAVNGGAFALAVWLAGGEARNQPIRIGGLEDHHIGLGMAFFTVIMCFDLFAFGLRFQQFFGPPGKLVIMALSFLLMAAWLLAGNVLCHLLPPSLLFAADLIALLAASVAAFLAAFAACLFAEPECEQSAGSGKAGGQSNTPARTEEERSD
jgi:hypothetical protein